MSRRRASRVIAAFAIAIVMLTVAPAYAAPHTVYDLAIDPSSPGTLYAAEALRILKSTDGGATWSISSSNLGTFSDQGLAIHPLVPTTLYLPGAKSTDGGVTWIGTGPPTYVSSVFVDPQTPTTLYAFPYICGIDDAGWCYDTEMLKSTDGGMNWSGTGLVAYQLVIDPVSPTTLYAVGSFNPYDPALQGPGLFKSTDGGVTWSRIHEALVGPAIDPVTPATVYAADAGGRVFRSTDAGANWAAIGATGASVKAFAIDPATPTTLYGLGAASIMKSTDGGATWSATGLGFGPPNYFVHPFAIDSVTPTTLYAATEAGLFKSNDGGASWNPTGQSGDIVSPDTTIASVTDGNGASVLSGAATLSRSVTFVFAGSDDIAVARFECRMDATNFVECASPVTYTSLTVGRHDFEVRAIDTSGNSDGSPARHTLTIDTPPETTITSAVDHRGRPVPNGWTASTSITFRFTGSDNIGVAGFRCSLDGAVLSACTSPITYAAVARGTHTFRVQAIDSNGFLDATPAFFTWRK